MYRHWHPIASALRVLDFSRITAYSFVIALHAFAFIVLVMPATKYSPIEVSGPEYRRTQFERIIPEPPPFGTAGYYKRQYKPVQPKVIPSRPIAVEIPTAENIQQAVEERIPNVLIPDMDTPPQVDTETLGGVKLEYLVAPPPAYPREALRQGLNGTVILKILVGIDGIPLEVTIQKSSGHRVLDQAAMSHILKRWKFRPATQNGEVIQAYGLVPIDFLMN